MYDAPSLTDRTLNTTATTVDTESPLASAEFDDVAGGQTEPAMWEAYFFEVWSQDSL